MYIDIYLEKHEKHIRWNGYATHFMHNHINKLRITRVSLVYFVAKRRTTP